MPTHSKLCKSKFSSRLWHRRPSFMWGSSSAYNAASQPSSRNPSSKGRPWLLDIKADCFQQRDTAGFLRSRLYPFSRRCTPAMLVSGWQAGGWSRGSTRNRWTSSSKPGRPLALSPLINPYTLPRLVVGLQRTTADPLGPLGPPGSSDKHPTLLTKQQRLA